MKKVQVSIQLPEGMVKKVSGLANKDYRSRSNMIEHLVCLGLEEYETRQDLLGNRERTPGRVLPFHR